MVQHFLHRVNGAASWSILLLICQFYQRNWEVEVHHAFREANFCSDFLAKLEQNCSLLFVLVDASSSGMTRRLNVGAIGVSFVRL